MSSRYTKANEVGLQAEVAELDPRWEWTLAQRLGMQDTWIRVRCLHTEVIPIESVLGDVVAQLCLTCDMQLPPTAVKP